jgi:hypothetical protein
MLHFLTKHGEFRPNRSAIVTSFLGIIMSYRYIYSCIFISRVALFFNAVNKPTELVAEVKRREIKVKEIQAEPFRDTERPKAQRGAA